MYYTSNIQYSSFGISSYIILNGQGNAALQGKVSISESDKCPSSCASVFFLYFGDFEVCYAYKISLCGVWGLNLLIMGLIGF